MTNCFDLFIQSIPLFMKGAQMTVQVLCGAAILSFSLGVCLGSVSCNRIRIRFLSSFASGFSFVVRAIPFYVQLLIIYFVVPDLLHFDLDAFDASILSLGICSSGYVAQQVRGALNAIPIAQWEAAQLLGYRKRKALLNVILPQVFRLILPSLNNELESLLKSTSIISSIGLVELTRVAMNLVSREMQPVPIYLGLALIYLLMSGILNLITKKLEQRFYYVKC